MPNNGLAEESRETDRANDGCADPCKMPRLLRRFLGENFSRQLQLCTDCLKLHVQPNE